MEPSESAGDQAIEAKVTDSRRGRMGKVSPGRLGRCGKYTCKGICPERWEMASGLGSLEARDRLHTHLQVSSLLKHNRTVVVSPGGGIP